MITSGKELYAGCIVGTRFGYFLVVDVRIHQELKTRISILHRLYEPKTPDDETVLVRLAVPDGPKDEVMLEFANADFINYEDLGMEHVTDRGKMRGWKHQYTDGKLYTINPHTPSNF